MKNSNLTKSEFIDAFKAANRANQFSYQGLEALYEYLTELEESLGEELELDVIGLCCDYSEHAADSLIREYGSLVDAQELAEQGDNVFETLMQYLENNTTVIPAGDNYIIQSF